METRRFLVKPKRSLFSLCAAFFGLCTWALTMQMAEPKDVYIFARLIHFTPEQSPYFFGTLAFLSAIFALIGLLAVASSFSSQDKFIEISDTDFVMPQLMFSRRKRLRFSDVRTFRETSVSGTHILEIRTSLEKCGITNRMLENNAVYDEIKALLSERIRVNGA